MKTFGKKPKPFEAVAKSAQPLVSDLKKFLASKVRDFEPEIRNAARDCISSRGKLIRPLLVFVSARGAKCDPSSLVRRAAIAELIHISSLVHDDIIDGADIRRNRETPNKKFGIKTAVLLGDAIFAHTMLLAFQECETVLSMKTVECVQKICEGEISQTLAKRGIPLTDSAYESAVRGKTAALFSLSCFLGASAKSGVDSPWAKAAEKIGDTLGIAYQIYDDACDWFMSEKDAGKTLGTDLAEGKQTFPLLALMKKLPSREAKRLAKSFDAIDQKSARELLEKNSILNDCEAAFMERMDRAEKILSKFPSEGEGLMEFCESMRDLFPIL